MVSRSEHRFGARETDKDLMTSAYKRQQAPLEAESDKHEMLCRVPVFRPVAAKLLQLLGNQDVSVHDVSQLLNSDPGFSTEMLTMANSAAYGSSHRIYTIEKAVVLLGLDRTRGLATKTALDSMIRGLGGSPTIQNCWRHSLATALIAKWLAPFYRLHPDLIYTTGLIHDVGRLGLLAAEPKQYSKLLDSAEGTSEDMLQVERWAFRVDHCEAGLFLTKTWGLPEEFWLPSSEHHAARNSATAVSVDIIRLACALAHALGYKAAPMIQTESAEALVEQIPDPRRPRGVSPLPILSRLLEKELGDVSGTTQGPEPHQCNLVN